MFSDPDPRANKERALDSKDSEPRLETSPDELPDLFGSDESYEPRKEDQPAEMPPPETKLREEDHDPLVGTMLNERYRVLSLLGKGGMSKVYKVQHVATQKLCAAKLMHSFLMSDPQAVQRFQREATAASRLNHPNAVSVSDLGMAESGQPFLIMELIDGISLAEEIRIKGRVDIKRSLHIFGQACSAIGHAHEKGIVHRDLKPSNIMIVESEGDPDFVKVVDFGIAKILPLDGEEAARLTGTGEIFGSPLYMSPEQCEGGELDATSDVYSMGCVIYETITGWAPFDTTNVLEVMYKHKTEMPAGLTGLPGDARLVKRMESIIFKAMAKSRESRYQSMRDLKADLDNATQTGEKGFKSLARAEMGTFQVLREISNRLGSSKKLVLIMLSIIILMGATLSGLFYWISSIKDPERNSRIIPVQRVFSAWSKDQGQFHRAEDVISQKEKAHDSEWPYITQEGMFFKKRLGDFYRNAGRTDQAMREYTAALRSMQQQKLEDNLGVDSGELHARIAELYLQAGKLNDAMENARIALRTFKRTATHGTPDVLIAYATMIEAQAKKGEFVSADMTMTQLNRELIAAQMRGKNTDLLQIALALQVCADFQFVRKDYGESQALYQQAIAAWKELGQDATFNMGATYNQLGMLEDMEGSELKAQGSKGVYANGKFSAALEDLEKAKQIIVDQKGTNNLDYARIMFNISDVLWHKEKYQEALKIKMEARKIWAQYQPNS